MFKIVVFILLLFSSNFAKDYFVSKSNSNDSLQDGSEIFPFKSIEKALEVCKKDSSDEDINIFIKEGRYQLENPLKISEKNVKFSNQNLTIKPYKNDSVVIDAGEKINPKNWVLFDSTKNIYTQKIEKNLRFRYLFVDGKRAIRARSKDYRKNKSPFIIGDKTNAGNPFIWIDSTHADFNLFANLKNPTDLEFVSTSKWRSFRIKPKSLNHSERGVYFRLDNDFWSFAYHNCRTWGQAYFNNIWWVESAYELLDEENEWYYDKRVGMLYYKPQKDKEISKIIIERSNLNTAIIIEGKDALVKNISLKNLNFINTNSCMDDKVGHISYQVVIAVENSAVKRGNVSSAIKVKNARNIKILENTFNNLGGNGINIDTNNVGHLVRGNLFTNIGGTAISLGMTPDSQKEITAVGACSDMIIYNNKIDNFGLDYFSSFGIFTGVVSRTTISNNTILNGPAGGIHLGWAWHDKNKKLSESQNYREKNIIAYNRVSNIGKVVEDFGGIYLYNTQGSQENATKVYRNIVANWGNCYAGLYLDNNCYYAEVMENISANTNKGGNWILVQIIKGGEAKKNLIYRNFRNGDTTYKKTLDNYWIDNYDLRNGVLKENNTAKNIYDYIAQEAGVLW